MSLLKSLFRRRDDRARMRPLYASVVAAARQPAWYVEGQVPDTVDGRFEMVSAMLSLVLLRLEAEGERHATESAELTEIFVDDMDAQLREAGVGDVVVGKHIGKMMSALGGRLGAYRNGLAAGGDLATALERNLYRGHGVDPAALDWVMTRLRTLHAAVMATEASALLEGKWPRT